MARRGYTTTIGKIAKVNQSRRVSEMRLLTEQLRQERRELAPAAALTAHTEEAPARH
ncbi:hypothetical protein QEZ54_08950 [Catellatospora sp. KI3]|uniref:hypothetical protein n=1 Tax=Catellatospora sp. KI3 TaxID=3041620 RepID=UPI00248318FA|nr:hypothetical protein [Catellatospora sp. KI3]MDI1461090.1 hypothetical protein [Catellatospora sp. KI3]